MQQLATCVLCDNHHPGTIYPVYCYKNGLQFKIVCLEDRACFSKFFPRHWCLYCIYFGHHSLSVPQTCLLFQHGVLLQPTCVWLQLGQTKRPHCMLATAIPMISGFKVREMSQLPTRLRQWIPKLCVFWAKGSWKTIKINFMGLSMKLIKNIWRAS